MTSLPDPNDRPRSSDNPMAHDRLDELLSQIVDEQLSPPAAAELSELLRDNPALQDEYISFMSLHIQLLIRSGLISSATAAHQSSHASPEVADVDQMRVPASDAATTPKTRTPVLGFLGGVVDYVSHSRTVMFWLIGCTLGLYFAVQLGSLLLSRFWAQNVPQVADDRGAGTGKHGHVVDQSGLGATDGKIVAKLTNAVDCQWKVAESGNAQGSDPQPSAYSLQPLDVGTEFHAGQKLNLAAGLAELTFDSGAKVILNAPSRFTVGEALGGNLQFGKLVAKVPHTAHGFTIDTPGGKVVDLGTEFGVKVTFDRRMDVIVYVGDVEINGSPVSAGSGATGEAPKGIHLHAGQAITLGPNQPAKLIDPKNERFVRDLTPLGDPAKAEAAYVEFMKSLKPVVWFRMEGNDADRMLHDESGNVPDVKLLWDGPGSPFVKGPVGMSLWLRGDKLKDCAIVPDYPKAEHGKLTVSAWAYAVNRTSYESIVKNWNRTGQGQFEFGLCGDGIDLSIQIADANGQAVLLREGLARPFPLTQWQHVAFVTDGSTLRLYRQGREVGAVQHDGLLFPVRIRALGIGVKTNRAGDAPGPQDARFLGRQAG